MRHYSTKNKRTTIAGSATITSTDRLRIPHLYITIATTGDIAHSSVALLSLALEFMAHFSVQGSVDLCGYSRRWYIQNFRTPVNLGNDGSEEE